MSEIVKGEVAPGYERVREAFEKSFAAGEVGAAVAVSVDGVPVVDLWGGHADAERTRAWERDTIVNVYSTTKGAVAVCAARLIEEGRLDPDAPVAHYWPEFAAAGKEAIPVRMLLNHQAGLAAIRRPLEAEARYDWELICSALAEQEPWWEPGTGHGYHALTYGYLVGEVIRRVAGRSVGTYFREELAEPLGLDFHIGTPDALHPRCADMIPAPESEDGAANPLAAAQKNPESLLGRVFGNPAPGSANSPEWRRAEIPAANGHGTARGLARLYGALVSGGSCDGIHVLSPEGLERATTEESYGEDAVLGPLRTRFGLGFMLTHPMIPFGPNPGSFGHPGAGGSIAFGDPDRRLGFGYVMNQMQAGLAGDARGFRLVAEAYAALEDGA